MKMMKINKWLLSLGIATLSFTAPAGETAKTESTELNQPLSYAEARKLGDTERTKKQYAAAVERYRQALAAADCDWRARFGTELTVIDCMNAERKFEEVIDFCDSVIARQEKHKRVAVLKGDYRLRKLEALHKLGRTDEMFAIYKELQESDANPNAKLGGVIALVLYHRSHKQWDKALAEGQTGLALKKTHPGLLNKLKSILTQIENQKKN
jgi:tetratricopeptide (TPR) repeat protein